ncbi:hypothetical protein HU200_001561 [Digitaria exilis]|uniref:Membrane-associated kinase regulator 6 n=1 Tax=Digitaria exilis TaxID=1010633 RepID=A0A835FZZ3_9POAL|nr:hypothetical protein HU200_001561 [Digitaria exilis]
MDIAPDATGTGTTRPISARAEMPSSSRQTSARAHCPPHHRTIPPWCSRSSGPALMEVASLQHLGDSFSCGWLKRGAPAAPSFERLVVDADLGHSFGSSTRSSFIDMDPADLFSMRWTTTAPPPGSEEFEFGLPGGGGDPASPPVLVSASQVIRDGRLLPSDPVSRRSSSGAHQRHGDLRVDDLPSAPRSSPSSPMYHSEQSTSARPPPLFAGGRRGRASSWKILVHYLRFLMPLYRKVRALRRFSAARPRVAPASPARVSTSSIEWCHGNADTAVRDAILYCKKSSVRPLPHYTDPTKSNNKASIAHTETADIAESITVLSD